MTDSPDFATIADSSRPNAGRIYDFLLGGNHNFEIDRQAAQKILSVASFLPEVLRLIRWFLGEAARRLTAEGFDKFLDFASGLPTQDHIHQIAPKGTRVIYSDIDPVTVEYAKEILKDNADTRYVHCDAAAPEEILQSGLVEELFGTDRRVAIGFNGIAYFLTDEQVGHALRTLHAWAAPGARLFLSDADSERPNERLQPLFEIYKQIGQPICIRTKERLMELAGPWKIAEPGFRPLEDWLDMARSVTEKQVSAWGGGGFVGAFLER